LCDAAASLCQRCRGLSQRRPLDPPTLGEIFGNSERDDDGCLLYGGEITNAGYGVIRRKSAGIVHRWPVHRRVYELTSGPIPDGHEIHHRCGTRRCVDPFHLEIVTRREHLGAGGRHEIPRDAKGRYTTAVGLPW
jgi:hypothetical protein